jgi:preprotein translocase subunit SecD
MRKYLIWSAILVLLFIISGYFLVSQQKPGAKFPFSFGLDLVGGTELVYRADTLNVEDVRGAMNTLKEVIERRVNIFGVSEPLIQTESAGLVSGNSDERLIIGLPGVTDIDKAIELIGQTPVLEFRLSHPDIEKISKDNPDASLDELFIKTGLSGRYLSKSRVEFHPTTGAPIVGLEFNSDGKDLFAELTREHKGEILAILLDGVILQTPVIVDEISDGNAQISGSFTPEEARDLVRNLNYGALPLPISFYKSETVGATLGTAALNSGIRAGIIGFVALSIFLILWYRLPGLISVVALTFYMIISLVIFKLFHVVLTAAGLAGFVLSVGMAVDANVLIFERLKEELKKGKSISVSLHEGFSRAWLSIRDSNVSSIITAIILFWLGTSAVKGFALTLGIGVLVSMLTAISISRTFLFAITPVTDTKGKRFLFSNGFHE